MSGLLRRTRDCRAFLADVPADEIPQDGGSVHRDPSEAFPQVRLDAQRGALGTGCRHVSTSFVQTPRGYSDGALSRHLGP